MKHIAFFSAVFFSGVLSWASPMWVTTAGLSSQDQLEKLAEQDRAKIKDVDLESIFDVELRSPVTQNQLTDLFKLEYQARNCAINGDFMKSLRLYSDLLKKLKTVPNASGIEKITFSTLLHLAQLKTLLHFPDADSTLTQAHAWGQGAIPSTSEFPPDLLQRFSLIQGIRSAVIAVRSPDDSTVLLDGRRLQSQELEGEIYRVHVEPGWHQIAVLTGGAPWAFKNLEIQKGQLMGMTLSPQSLAAGSCYQPQYKGPSLPRKTRLLVDFGDGCERIFYNNTWFSISGSPLDIANLAPAAVQESVAMPMSSPEPQQETPARHGIFKSPWFWAGVGVLTAGIVMAATQNQNQQTIVVPSHVLQ